MQKYIYLILRRTCNEILTYAIGNREIGIYKVKELPIVI
jgi:hypothetical protein